MLIGLHTCHRLDSCSVHRTPLLSPGIGFFYHLASTFHSHKRLLLPTITTFLCKYLDSCYSIGRSFKYPSFYDSSNLFDYTNMMANPSKLHFLHQGWLLFADMQSCCPRATWKNSVRRRSAPAFFTRFTNYNYPLYRFLVRDEIASQVRIHGRKMAAGFKNIVLEQKDVDWSIESHEVILR